MGVAGSAVGGTGVSVGGGSTGVSVGGGGTGVSVGGGGTGVGGGGTGVGGTGGTGVGGTGVGGTGVGGTGVGGTGVGGTGVGGTGVGGTGVGGTGVGATGVGGTGVGGTGVGGTGVGGTGVGGTAVGAGVRIGTGVGGSNGRERSGLALGSSSNEGCQQSRSSGPSQGSYRGRLSPDPPPRSAGGSCALTYSANAKTDARTSRPTSNLTIPASQRERGNRGHWGRFDGGQLVSGAPLQQPDEGRPPCRQGDLADVADHLPGHVLCIAAHGLLG